MIANAKQYEITQQRIAQFSEALERIQSIVDPSISPILRQAQIDAITSQLEEMRAEIEAYTATPNAAPSKAGERDE